MPLRRLTAPDVNLADSKTLLPPEQSFLIEPPWLSTSKLAKKTKRLNNKNPGLHAKLKKVSSRGRLRRGCSWFRVRSAYYNGWWRFFSGSVLLFWCCFGLYPFFYHSAAGYRSLWRGSTVRGNVRPAANRIPPGLYVVGLPPQSSVSSGLTRVGATGSPLAASSRAAKKNLFLCWEGKLGAGLGLLFWFFQGARGCRNLAGKGGPWTGAYLAKVFKTETRNQAKPQRPGDRKNDPARAPARRLLFFKTARHPPHPPPRPARHRHSFFFLGRPVRNSHPENV